ncbi:MULTISPECIES: HAD family phosphatase [unclassified Pseudomonas]|uniref:HAD family hydrolase n=1 Tax=unclassified Pseudomonas TaxID=196821 RepID=UPI002AC8D038|nr:MULTISPECIES: HAD family phosphatase [unclassified Pseudomonas]MEB0044138.1 HAD family phosphatase [Pseudomonas sp. Dout3]MEB0094925.1 HAD family phosphatase [Pseudomonas sp. DC1.2]WPX59716.1 HAD family phosphatase [Pseudomonas sp. DC1.2]
MTQRTFTAVCFDMDGVLIQSREVIECAWTTVARHYGVAVDQAFIREHIHGRPGGYTLQALFGQFGEQQRQVIKREVDAIEQVSACALTPGVATLIAQLQDAAVPLALVTSSWRERVEHVLHQHDLKSAFDSIVCRDDVRSGKPAPDAYRLAAAQLQRHSDECLVFEDSLSGVQAAISSGALCVGIGDDLTLTAHGASGVYADFGALPVSMTNTKAHVYDRDGLFIGVPLPFRDARS